jgi:glycosyltransferase involved in cell wall biosynthesis
MRIAHVTDFSLPRLGGVERHVHEGEIPRAFQHGGLFLAPATLESFGIAALEARCSGLPVLARGASGAGAFVVEGQAVGDGGMVRGLVRLAGDLGNGGR